MRREGGILHCITAAGATGGAPQPAEWEGAMASGSSHDNAQQRSGRGEQQEE